MKHKIFLSLLSFLSVTGALTAQSGGIESAPAAPARDTVYKNATQYALDSMKYAAEYVLQTTLESLRTERYKDSVVYARMSASQLYDLQMARTNRYWTPPFRRFMDRDFPPLLVAASLLLAFGMVLRARDRGKQRAHEQKMAQFEAMQKARIVLRERRAASASADPGQDSSGGDLEWDDAFEGPDYEALFHRASHKVASYIRSPRRYRKTGVVLLIVAVGMMLFFGTLAGGSGAWTLGLIPLFIGFAYLYLDYASLKSELQRREYEEFKRYKAEKEAVSARPTSTEGPADSDNRPEEPSEK